MENEKEKKKDLNVVKSTNGNDDEVNIMKTQKNDKTSSPISNNDANRIAAEKWRQENSALSSLMANYDSSSEEESVETSKKLEQNKQLETNDGEKLNLENSKNNNSIEALVKSYPQDNQNEECSNNTISQNDKYRTKPCRFFLRNGTCKNGDNCLYIHDITSHKQYLADAVKRREQQSRRDRTRHVANQELNILRNGNAKHSSHLSYNPSSSTLLRKLLAKDMERERSLTLQLLRYIVDCNYLQKQKLPRSAEKHQNEQS